MKMSKKRKRELKVKARRIFAAFMALTILFQIIAPSAAYALTGGPSQPEVQSFEPIGTSDMVDPFSGDFNYNIPLMDVDGYPINISYHSGITMDQEASMVGLGWNINPGVINRGMRGIPDDFNGDNVVKELNMKPNNTYGLNTGAGIELFGSEKLKLGLETGMGIRYNNYNGVSIENSINLSLGAGESGSSPLTANLGIKSSSDDGLSLNPTISFSAKIVDNEKTSGSSTSLTASVGTSFNSRGGLKSLTIGASVSSQMKQVVNGKTARNSFGGGKSGSFDFGMPTYTPQAGLPMQNFSVTGNFKIGFEVYGLNPSFNIGGYFSSQRLSQKTISSPAFGYMNSDEGVKFDNALLDFNREKDGIFSTSTPALPVTNYTYDIYSVAGQGVGGSYRAFRGDLGHVYDAATNTTSDGFSTGFEIGVGNLTHYGFDFSVTDVKTQTGRWSSDNDAASRLTSRATSSDPLYERYYFKEANEKSVDSDPTFFANAGSSNPKSVKLNQQSKFNTVADPDYTEGGTIPSDNTRKKRERRNQSISVTSRGDIAKYGLEDNTAILLPESYADNYKAKNHHIAEITTLRTDGARYVYGIAAYNTKQEEVSFAVGETIDGDAGRASSANSGLTNYSAGDNSTGNALGIDNYFSNTIMPAYAHSYLLTAVLSPDYVDSDNIRGPSKDDIGNYTKFSYEKVEAYKWRVPVEPNKATHSEGLKSDKTDDKANYVYGEKELWYVSKIETKNYIAIFEMDDRDDGYGVIDKNGGRSTGSSAKTMKLLKKISLFTKPDYENSSSPTPIKEVHFVYDYSLCKGVFNNVNFTSGVDNGKLTLKEIFFTYQKSNKARLSPYKFVYSSSNPNYNIKGYDRWGNFKPNTVLNLDATNPIFSTAEYPYVEQDKTTADSYAQAWSLVEVGLPSGGTIKVDYESDDYAYVQNKQAMQMFKVVGIQDNASAFSATTSPGGTSVNLNPSSSGARLIIKLQETIDPGLTATQKKAEFIEKYMTGIHYLYFRFLMAIKPGKYEYVSGYLKPGQYNTLGIEVDASGQYAGIPLGTVTTNDGGGDLVCPITKAAIQFGRLNMPRTVWNSADLDGAIGDHGSFGKSLLEAIINSNFFANIADAIQGPNQALYKDDVGTGGVIGKSFIRLNNPNKHKLGGGVRVKKIRISDEWDGTGITTGTPQAFSYGQEYTYTLPDGTSSGVASYEPQLGGDENPWKQPIFTSEEKILAPDDEHYMEEPFGESFFPSPSVGYSRVTVKNLQRKNVKHNATGKVVHEFYTAKDFPTITERTELTSKREKSDPFSISSLLHIDVKDYMTASQGFVIETNDMHGKPKKQEVYQESQTSPITSVEYKYKSTPYLVGSSRLNNKATVIYNNGTINNSTDIGVFFDFVSDMREHNTSTIAGSINGNIDGFLVAAYTVYVPIIIPSFTSEKLRFRSAVITKVVQRFGILEETIAKDLGSTVSTKNLAYDAETGDVLLTQTTTDFNDKVYSMTYPAHWYYDGMGPAYRNIGFAKNNVAFSSVGIAPVANAKTYFSEGDELSLKAGSTAITGWVSEVTASTIHVIDRDGINVSGTYNVKVIRSGRKNQTEAPMASLTSLNNPLTHFNSNEYENVLQAQAMEYTNNWKTFCDCFKEAGSYTTNPYILGTKGIYKNKKSYLYLTGRTQSNYDNNTNIRKDGVFVAYSPFYKLDASKWDIDNQNWTYTSEVTEFSPYGAELENMDALGRFSSASYGYNQTLPTAVAANTKYRSLGFDNFEDYKFSDCADNHFKFRNSNPDDNIVNTQSHTGRNSIKVSAGAPIELTNALADCDVVVDCGFTHKFTCIDSYCFDFSGGTAPYVFEWTSSGCDPVVTITGSQICIERGTAPCNFILSVTDATGCKKIYLPIIISETSAFCTTIDPLN